MCIMRNFFFLPQMHEKLPKCITSEAQFHLGCLLRSKLPMKAVLEQSNSFRDQTVTGENAAVIQIENLNLLLLLGQVIFLSFIPIASFHVVNILLLLFVQPGFTVPGEQLKILLCGSSFSLALALPASSAIWIYSLNTLAYWPTLFKASHMISLLPQLNLSSASVHRSALEAHHQWSPYCTHHGMYTNCRLSCSSSIGLAGDVGKVSRQ